MVRTRRSGRVEPDTKEQVCSDDTQPSQVKDADQPKDCKMVKQRRTRCRGRVELEKEQVCSEDAQSSQVKDADQPDEDDHDTDELDEEASSESSTEGEDGSRPSKRHRRSSAQAAQPTQSWRTEEDSDEAPPELAFHPARTPGAQMSSADTHTPLDLFKLFFTEEAVKTLCDNTNKQVAIHVAKGAKYKWTNIGVSEMYKFMGLIFYMSVIKLDHVTAYWRQNSIFCVPFPATVMARERCRCIAGNIKMSDPHKDQENDKKSGTPEHDSLFQARPLLDTIRNACKALYHPHKNLAMHDRVSGSNHFRLFVLADAGNGYIVDLAVFTGKHSRHMGRKVSCDAVLSLVDHSVLGSGYHVYMDIFFTSPKLFRALHGRNMGACGMHSYGIKNCPRSISNALTKSSGRGAIRWIRDGPLLFVKWMDAGEVCVCSTIHSAYAGDTVQRTVRSRKGASTTKTYPCPSPVVDYHKHMGGVGVSEPLSQDFATQHRNGDWSRKLFFHFLDMAARNACIIYNELVTQRQQTPLSYKAFLKELTVQLCEVSNKRTHHKQVSSDHVPVPVDKSPDARRQPTQGCVLCTKNKGKRHLTAWKCKGCDVALCLQFNRNCFEEWHKPT
ncbi:piggyBac transposable element-derived protein 4-like isoform X2 [Sardina pilchardus]|uniref:piggyBac transposable element-derived protein 4-like isoform X2 n=1 Tax=Sardina pilchardus TaxID=27697 RepID=UPI002E0E8751